jgi:hypothetical protein
VELAIGRSIVVEPEERPHIVEGVMQAQRDPPVAARQLVEQQSDRFKLDRRSPMRCKRRKRRGDEESLVHRQRHGLPGHGFAIPHHQCREQDMAAGVTDGPTVGGQGHRPQQPPGAEDRTGRRGPVERFPFVRLDTA